MRRRDFLTGAGAAATMGIVGVPAVSDGVALYSTNHPVSVAWAVGRSDYTWGVYFAETVDDAIAAYADWECIDRCEDGHRAGTHCGNDACDMCNEYGQIEGQRSTYMDKFVGSRNEITDIDYWHIGWSVPCHWCLEQSAYNDCYEWPDSSDLSLTEHGYLLCEECYCVYDKALTAEYGPDLRYVDEEEL